jgi:ferredoxin
VLRISVDEKRCQGHGRCYDVEPDLFEPDINGRTVVIGDALSGPATLLAAERAVRNCPEYALTFGLPTDDEGVQPSQDPTPRSESA